LIRLIFGDLMKTICLDDKPLIALQNKNFGRTRNLMFWIGRFYGQTEFTTPTQGVEGRGEHPLHDTVGSRTGHYTPM
jgi:hypothetical protein